jgi:heavy metal sensor kinase
MHNSVRVRLTGWYVGVLSLVLISFSAGVYTLLARAARNDLDHELGAAIDVLSRSLRHEIAEHEGKAPGEESFNLQVLSTVYRDSFPGIAIAVYDGPRLVGSKPGPGANVPPSPAAAAKRLQFETFQNGDVPWRAAKQTIVAEGAGEYQFVATSSLFPVEEALANLRGTFYLAIPLALAAAAIGGFLLARKSLAPVVEMSDTADRISSKDLTLRIPAGNPKDELGRLAATFNRLLERLERAFSSQRQFMEDSSHELRTPIYVAHTAAQVTLERTGRSEEEYREALGTIDQQLRRLQHIVEDLFVLARADAGEYPLQVADFDLGETITECVRAAALMGQQVRVTVGGPMAQEMPMRGDEGLIRQAILILLDNAVKYTPEGGRVVVEVAQSDPKTYQVVVKDTGIGIPPEAREKIFERFYRVDKARSRATVQRGSGAGLGLAIAKWIVMMHDGSLSVVDSGPGGTTFRVTLRRA